MTSETTPSRPIRCTACAKPMDSPVCCTSCGALNPLPRDAFNYFDLLGIEPGYDIDEQALHDKYLSLTRSVHPDVVGKKSAETRQRSLSLSSELNRAYDTLRDPVSRAEYLLDQVAGPAASEEPGANEQPTPACRSVPQCLLADVMLLREEIEDARAAGDKTALQALRQRITARRQPALEAIATLSRSLADSEPDTQDKLREQLNTIKYWDNLLDQLPPGDTPTLRNATLGN